MVIYKFLNTTLNSIAQQFGVTLYVFKNDYRKLLVLRFKLDKIRTNHFSKTVAGYYTAKNKKNYISSW